MYQATSIIVATGFYDLPFLLNIPGESLPKVKHYYQEAHPYFGMNMRSLDLLIRQWMRL